jgi:hypothetical protein
MTHQQRIEFWRQLHERGFQLMPLAGKVPVKGSEGWQAACVTGRPFNPAEYPEGMNAGILTGPASGVMVLDVDDKELFLKHAAKNKWTLPPTLEVITGGGQGKTHHYFKYPRDGRDYGNLGRAKTLGFDNRGVGGYVVAAESTHPDTKRPYKLAYDRPRADPPEWLLKLYDDRDVPQDAADGPQGLDVDALPVSAAVKDFIVSGAPKGQRSELFFKMLCSLLGIGIGARDITALCEQYPGGEKFREQGRGRHRWLEGEIRRAKAHLNKCDTFPKDKENFLYMREGLTSTPPENEKLNENGDLTKGTSTREVDNLNKPQQTSTFSQLPGGDKKAQVLLDLYRQAGCTLFTRDITEALKWPAQQVYTYNEYLRRKGHIERDTLHRGGHRYLEPCAGFYDFKRTARAPHLALWMWAGLDKYLNIDRGSIIGVSGEPGSAKTTMGLLLARMNDDRHRVVYIYTEPDIDAFTNKIDLYSEETDERLRRSRAAWNMRVRHIENFCARDAHLYCEKDCLNIIDWLKLTGDEHLEVNDILWKCKEKIGDGLLVVMMQKSKMKEYAVGGPQTQFLATLYVTLQKIGREGPGEQGVDRYIRVDKARNLKSWRNPEGQRIPFKIVRGTKIILKGSFEFDDEDSSSHV